MGFISHRFVGGGGLEPTSWPLSRQFWIVDGPRRIPTGLSPEAAGGSQRRGEGISEPQGKSNHRSLDMATLSGLQPWQYQPHFTQRKTLSKRKGGQRPAWGQARIPALR